MMKTKSMMLVMLSVLLVAACGAPITPPIAPTSPLSVPTSPPSVLPTMPASPLNPDSSSSTGAAPGQATAVANARKDLAEQINVDPSVITVVSVEAVDWPDGCLGVQTPGVMCTMVITSGYRVILEANGKQYEYHTNANGSAVRLATVK